MFIADFNSERAIEIGSHLPELGYPKNIITDGIWNSRCRNWAHRTVKHL